MQELARYIETHSERGVSLNELAKQAQLSPAHLQRRFKQAIGVSPKEYLDACRMKRLKQNLQCQQSVTDAIYESGFGSSSRVYERSSAHLGMTPKAYRAKGRAIEISYADADTPFGCVMMGATDRGLCFIQFGDAPDVLLAQLRREYAEAVITPMATTQRTQFNAWMSALFAYLKGEEKKLELPLDIRGTAFQMKVWKYLQKIPPGALQSYKEVAAAIGHPKAVRAVASACARNRIAIAIPCHRVIRGNGELAGYRWGLERKRALIDLERKKR